MIRACLITGAVIGLVFAMLFAATAWGQDTPPKECDALSRVPPWLAKEYGETPVGHGETSAGFAAILTLGPRSWSLLGISAPGPDPLVCMIGVGPVVKGRPS